jgi:hypothetical protein
MPRLLCCQQKHALLPGRQLMGTCRSISCSPDCSRWPSRRPCMPTSRAPMRRALHRPGQRRVQASWRHSRRGLATPHAAAAAVLHGHLWHAVACCSVLWKTVATPIQERSHLLMMTIKEMHLAHQHCSWQWRTAVALSVPMSNWVSCSNRPSEILTFHCVLPLHLRVKYQSIGGEENTRKPVLADAH